MSKELPLSLGPQFPSQSYRSRIIAWLRAIALGLLVVGFLSKYQLLPQLFANLPDNPDSLCPLVQKIDPSEYLYDNTTLDYILHDSDFRTESIKKLADAVKIPTEVYDEMVNPGSRETLEELYKVEPGWKNFEDFHKYLQKAFPLVHKNLKVEKVNKLALVYTWKGSDNSKKPILLTAHQDVVPVQKETIDKWTYPPFEGKYDGKFLYGRGVTDCKNLLIGLLETVELLLSEGKFSPERTVVLGFGYDEESSGSGARAIFDHLVKIYGEDSFLQLIDEGNAGYTTVDDLTFILPAVGEKGHLNSVIELYTPGGHSSVPQDHTSIGILAQLINKIEAVQYKGVLTKTNPVLNMLQCRAQYSKDIDTGLKSSILKAHLDQKANEKVIAYLSEDLLTKYLITTSQAADIVSGGAKSNALPEYASVLVNQRIAVEETVGTTSTKILNQIKEVVDKFDLGLVFDGNELIEPTANGYFNYSLVEAFDPAPITPTDGESWNVFGGALRYLYEDLLFPDQKDTYVVAPFISTGNTDTRAYWALTRNIYRYEPLVMFENSNVHSVDEKLLFDGHLAVIAFYYYYLQVIDKADDLKF